ncbi:MAG TPA: thioredoxin family protein [Coriobacteriia bacterium]|nr:thioredoxin family protein [Coriobacteriia bacterium]
MPKVKVEFINTCPSCDGYGRLIQDVAAGYGEDVDVRIYFAGKDFDYLQKYGPVTRGTMIVNGSQRYETITRSTVEEAIASAMSV